MARQKAKYLVRSLLTTALLCSLIPARAQDGKAQWTDGAAGETGLFGIKAQQLAYLDKSGKAATPGKTFWEVLRGNGTRAGYMLSHGGIIPGSLRVSVGVRTMRADRDYYLDAGNGQLFFAEPVRQGESVNVSYRYVEGQDGQRNPLGASTLALNMRGTALSFGYGVSNFNGLDFTTYGLNMNSKFGSGSGLSGLVYFSTPAGNANNLTGVANTGLRANQQKTNPEDAKNDHLIVQDLNLKSGAATFRATYQDIGSHFNGFQAMRQTNAGNKDVLGQINTLEKEKGVQRLGFGMGLAAGKGSNLGLNWDTIKDGNDQILRQNIGYQSKAFNFNYSTQSVGEKFGKFQGLREAEAGQWAREKGMNRTNLALGFAAGKGGAFAYNQDEVGDRNGSLSRQGFNFTSKTLNFSYGTRRADAKFGRINDLTDAEKTSLALDIRKQFNPNAQTGEVNAKDKEQIALDAGLTRSQMAFSTALGKNSSFAFNQFGIGDGKGDISRRTFDFKTGNLSFNYLDQTISKDFERLGRMSDFEKSQFANERGIHRNAMGLNLTLGKGSAFGFNQLSLSDAGGSLSRQSFAFQGKGMNLSLKLSDTASSFTRARDIVGFNDAEKAGIEAERGYKRMDLAASLAISKNSSFAFSQLSLQGQDGGVTRQNFNYAQKGIDLHFGMADTSKSFDRARNLFGVSDADKASIEAERGYKRTDFSANINTIKGLALSTYVYNAKNAADDLGKGAFRHSLVWDPGKRTHISFLTEGNDFSRGGTVQDGRKHDLFTFDQVLGKGMKFNMFHDTVATISGAKTNPDVVTDFLHFETDRSKANNLMAQSKRINFGNGRHENTTEFDANYKPVKTMALHYNKLTIDRGAEPSLDTDTLQWNWQAMKTMNFTGAFITTHTNNRKDTATTTFALDGMLTKNLKFTGNFSDTTSQDQSLRAGSKGFALSGAVVRDIAFTASTTERSQAGKSLGFTNELAFSNNKPMNLLGMKNVTFTAKYSAMEDRTKKQQTELVSGKVQGMIGKNQIGLEYGGALNADGKNALARTFTFVSDPNEKLPFHFSLLYKARNINRSDIELVRAYKLSYRIDKITNLTYDYTSMPEDGNGNMQPVKSSNFAFNRTINKQMAFTLKYVTSQNFATKIHTNKLGALIKGRLDKLTAVQVGYDVNLGNDSGQNVNTHTITLGYDRQIDGDHFLTLSTAYTMGRGASRNDVAANIDFKTIF